MRKLISQVLTTALALTVSASVSAAGPTLRKAGSPSPQEIAMKAQVVNPKMLQQKQPRLLGHKQLSVRPVAMPGAKQLAQRKNLVAKTDNNASVLRSKAPRRAAAAADPTIYGIVPFNTLMADDETLAGLYTIPVSEGLPQQVKSGIVLEPGVNVVENVLYGQSAMSFWGMSFLMALESYDTES